MSTSQDEKRLVQKIIDRDEKALLGVYKENKNKLQNYIFRQLNDYHLAEEITQDVFLDFVESLRDFNFQCSIRTFLFSIAKNKVIDVIRKKKLKKILFSALPPYFVEGLKTILMDDEIEKKELTGKIKSVMEKLPNDYRLVLRLKYIEGEKVIDIAKKLSISFKATESLIFRARKAFVKVFEKLP